MKLWSGRFDSDSAGITDEINSSIDFDSRLYAEDIEGSRAHAAMLAVQGIISPTDADRIIEGLDSILADIESGKVSFTRDNEDIHMNIEALLTQRIGEAGKRLHTARSRNDQVALDIRLYLKKEIVQTDKLLRALISVIADRAEGGYDIIMPAYTHLQRAQPTTFAHYMMAYANMLRRDCTRLADCLERMDYSPLGSGALTSTTYPIDRRLVARALGFRGITENSLDGVSDRDFAVELLSDLSIVMLHLSRFAEELILWSSWEFKFIEMDDAFSTGSSIMPQKKNPDVAELVRGKTGRVYGSLISLLTVLKGLPLAYNKDMQEDKEPLFDAIDTVKLCLRAFAPMIATMKLLPENMRRAAGGGFINATDCADWLTKKGVPFRDAYTVTGKLVNHCIKEGKTLEELSVDELRAFSPVFDESVFEAIRLENCVEARIAEGGPSRTSVEAQLRSIRDFLETS